MLSADCFVGACRRQTPAATTDPNVGGNISGKIGKLSMSRVSRHLQIGTGPRCLPSASSEISKRVLGLTSMRSSQRSEARTRMLQHCQSRNAWWKQGLWGRSLAITLTLYQITLYQRFLAITLYERIIHTSSLPVLGKGGHTRKVED